MEVGDVWVLNMDTCDGGDRVSSMESLSNDDEAVVSLVSVKEIDHFLSPILGLALMALVLTRLGMVDRMTTSLDVGVGLATFAFFWSKSKLGHDLFLLNKKMHIFLFIVINFTNFFQPLWN